jgi:hypothetical protein
MACRCSRADAEELSSREQKQSDRTKLGEPAVVYDPREVAELWVREDCACGEASVLLGTLYGWARRFPMLHLREREEDLLRTHELIVRFEGTAGEKG